MNDENDAPETSGRRQTPLQRARARHEERDIERHGGTSGRVVADSLAPFGVRVDLVVRPNDLRGDHPITETLPANYLNDLLGGVEPGAVQGFWTDEDAVVNLMLRPDHTADLMRIDGSVKTMVQHSCVRCLQAVRFKLELDLALRAFPGNDELFAGETVVLDPQRIGGGKDERDDDAMNIDDDEDFITYAHGKMDLARVIREQIFLELPAHPRCDSKGAETDGPCVFDAEGKAAEEAGRWQDPRWDALRSLSDKLKN